MEMWLCELTHQGYVYPDEDLPREPHAEKVVRKAVARALLGISSTITWDPRGFCARTSSSDEFEEFIRQRVEELVDDPRSIIYVDYLGGRSFEVRVLLQREFKFLC